MNQGNYSKKGFLVFVLIATFIGLISVNGQSASKIKAQVASYMEAVRNEAAKPDISGLYESGKSRERLLGAVSEFFNDTVYEIRLEAYSIAYTTALKSTETDKRQMSVGIVVKGLNDSNGSIVRWASGHLSVFNREDFSNESRQVITKSINENKPGLAELVKVAGYLNIKEAEGAIVNIASYSKKTSVKWAAYLALARMGKEEYINKVTAIVRKQGLNDDVVFELIPGLIYTRQKECIGYVIEALYENKKKCTSTNPDNPVRVQCGYRIMEYLAPVVKGFPYKVKVSGDIDTDDYKEALITIREWFLEKGSGYEIIDNSF